MDPVAKMMGPSPKKDSENVFDEEHRRTKGKLVYFIKQPLTKRDSDRYGIDFFLNHGHEIIIFDFTKLLHPEAPTSDDMRSRSKLTIYEISRWGQLGQYEPIIGNAKLALFLIQSHGLSKTTYRPLRLLTKLGIPYVIFSPTPHPGSHIDCKGLGLFQRARDLLTRLISIDYLNSIIRRVPVQWFGIRRADYVVVHSLNASRSNKLIDDDTINIKNHSFDYELYMRELERASSVLDQAVFIDQYMPYHRDFMNMKSNPLDPDSYYSTMRRIFDRIEQELGLKVVIAAHPRTDCRDHQKGFGNREIRYGDTIHLVAESKLVLGHNSTALSFAVLFEKPVMLLVTKPLYERQVYEKYFYQAFAETLGTTLRFIDDPDNVVLSDPYFIDPQKYEQYKSHYIKYPGSLKRPFWEIVTDAILELNGTN